MPMQDCTFHKARYHSLDTTLASHGSIFLYLFDESSQVWLPTGSRYNCGQRQHYQRQANHTILPQRVGEVKMHQIDDELNMFYRDP